MGLRARWKALDGRIIEWNYRHGHGEIYDYGRKHLGGFDADTGRQTKNPDSTGRVGP
jgi:hypothetical protein